MLTIRHYLFKPEVSLLDSDLQLKACHKKQEILNRRGAKYAEFKTPSKSIVQNRVSVLDKANFSFAASRQMKKFLPSLATLET